MVRVTPIKLQAGTRVLWFDPAEYTVCAGDRVIVSTERGSEFGVATSDIMEVSDELIEQLKSPLKPVLRIADEADIERAEELRQKGEEALATFKELAAEASDQMRPVMVEFLFDGDKAVFYFESEERIDFRDLVRKLASVFHVRVDMRQIGVRDGARMIGGLGHCGQELCCARMGGEFSPVSIRMAKEQNLSLNPQKISGCCGRLMCCLRYEYEAYKEVNSRAPKVGAKIEIPDGIAKVTEINVPLERITLQLEDGKTFKVPLEEMEVAGEGKRPNHISQEVFDRYASTDPFTLFEMASSSSNLEVASFTAEDKLAEPKARAVKPSRSEATSQEDKHRRPRRRRSVEISTDGEGETKRNSSNNSNGENSQRSESSRRQERFSARSAKDSRRDQREKRDKQTEKQSRERQRDQRENQLQTQREKQLDQRRERRRHPASSHKAEQGQENQATRQHRERRNRSNRNERNNRFERNDRVERTTSNDRPSQKRPGQKSSGVRNAPTKTHQYNRRTGQPTQQSRTAPNEAKQAAAHRKPRRRQRKTGGDVNNAK